MWCPYESLRPTKTRDVIDRAFSNEFPPLLSLNSTALYTLHYEFLKHATYLNMTESPLKLTPEQSHSLFDILTHHSTYAEIEAFKIPGAIHTYGPPFQDDRTTSTSPILQTLLSKFILELPGLRDVSPDFWKVRVRDIIEELSEAELSESYDKGVLGIRKTLATAISALIEYPARGCLGGLQRREIDTDRIYDTTNADDVLQAWRDALQEAIYGDLIDEIFEKVAVTGELKDHSSLVQGMHEFLIVK